MGHEIMETTVQRMQNIGDNIRIRRAQTGMTQEALADKAGVSRATINGLECGRYSTLLVPTIEAIAVALGVRMPTLMRDVK